MDASKVNTTICELIIAEFERRVYEESFVRLKKCIDYLNEDEIWFNPNMYTNSVGNLTLHLCGNARQYITSGIGGKKDTRKRQEEFDSKDFASGESLKLMLDDLKDEIQPILAQLTQEKLLEKKKVQGFEETVLSILVHVIEHFSYHTGQVTFIVKLMKNIDTGYYAGIDLDITE